MPCVWVVCTTTHVVQNECIRLIAPRCRVGTGVIAIGLVFLARAGNMKEVEQVRKRKSGWRCKWETGE